jgi:hypothetical protein
MQGAVKSSGCYPAHFLLNLGPVITLWCHLLASYHGYHPVLPQPDLLAGALVGTAFHAPTDWVMFLEESGLQEVNQAARLLLFNPPAVTSPFGTKGFTRPTPEAQEGTCLTSLVSHRPADFFVPPFVLPRFIFSDEKACLEHGPDSRAMVCAWTLHFRQTDALTPSVASL